MALLPLLDPVDYLVRKKFPKVCISEELGEIRGIFGLGGNENQREEAEKYRQELKGKTVAELTILYNEACREDVKRRAEEAAEAEKRLFFHLPSADADFEYWSRAEYWENHEAIALTFGKDPEKVTYNRVVLHEKTSPFAKEYLRLHELVKRARDIQLLAIRTTPLFYIQWVQKNKIPFPEKLVELLRAKHDIRNWEQEYRTLAAQHNTLNSQYTALEQRVLEAENALALQPTNPSWVSPYMELMTRCIKENNLSPENQSKKETLKIWFLENAPENLDVSENKAGALATLVRLPEAGKGGNKKLR